MGSLKIAQPIGSYVTNAFASEFKFAGFELSEDGLVLKGQIQELKAGDLGFSVDWVLKMQLALQNRAGKTIATKAIVVTKNTNKFGDISSMLNPVLKEAFEQLASDKNFRSQLH